MAVLDVFGSFGPGSFSEMIDAVNTAPWASSPSRIWINYQNSFGAAELYLYGKFTAFDGTGYPTAGTLTGIDFSYFLQPQFRLTHFSIPVDQFTSAVNGGDANELVAQIFAGNDILNGSEHGDDLVGYAGNDRIYGFGGDDTLIGNGGRDILDGGTGNDTLQGGADNDIYVIDSASDVIVENAGEGVDFVQTSVSYTLSANVERMYLMGSGNIDGTGNDLANLLVGNTGNNMLSGMGANDRLYGGAGNDTLNGGDANDYLEGGAGQDDLIGGAGKDYFVFRDGDTGSSIATADRIEDRAWRPHQPVTTRCQHQPCRQPGLLVHRRGCVHRRCRPAPLRTDQRQHLS